MIYLLFIKVALTNIPSLLSFLMEFVRGDPAGNNRSRKSFIVCSILGLIIFALSNTLIRFMDVAEKEKALRLKAESDLTVSVEVVRHLESRLSSKVHLLELSEAHLSEARAKLGECRKPPTLNNNNNPPPAKDTADDEATRINREILRNLGVGE